MTKRAAKAELCQPVRQAQKRAKKQTGLLEKETGLLVTYSSSAHHSDIDVSRIGAPGSGSSLLEQLFPALDGDQFRSTLFRRGKAVLAKGHASRCTRLADDHMHKLSARRLLEESASPAIEVWLKQADGGGLESIQVAEATEALHLYGAGHSLYCRASRALEELLVPRLLQELQYGVRGSTDRFQRGEIETFFSRHGHVTDFHTDFQENMTIMLSGAKRWTFAARGPAAPLRGCTPHYRSKEVAETQLKALRLSGEEPTPGDEQQECVLRAGDVMYHPAGIWHRVECLEDSVSINISLVACSAADVLCGGLQQLLQRDVRFRSALCGGKGRSRATVEEMIAAAQALLSKLRAEDLLPDVCFLDRTSGEEGCPDGCGHDHGAIGGGGNGSGDNDSDGDEEEEEEEDGGSDDVVLTVHDDLYERLSLGERGDKSLEGRVYRANPLAVAVRGAALRRLGWRDGDVGADEVYAVHVGFGNEGCESLSRVLLRVNGAAAVAAFEVIVSLFESATYNVPFLTVLVMLDKYVPLAAVREQRREGLRLLAADVLRALEKCGFASMI